MLDELAYQITKKIAYAKANGATREQAEKYAGVKITDSIYQSISSLTYEKSDKHKDGWKERSAN